MQTYQNIKLHDKINFMEKDDITYAYANCPKMNGLNLT